MTPVAAAKIPTEWHQTGMAAKAVNPRLRASIYRALDRAGPCSRRTASRFFPVLLL